MSVRERGEAITQWQKVTLKLKNGKREMSIEAMTHSENIR
jgi:hypothetical protein